MDAKDSTIFSCGGFSLYGPRMSFIASVHYCKCYSTSTACQDFFGVSESMLVFGSVFELQCSCSLFPNMHADNEPTVWSWTAPPSLSHSSPSQRDSSRHHLIGSDLKPKPEWSVCLLATTGASPSKFKETCLDLGGGARGSLVQIRQRHNVEIW